MKRLIENTVFSGFVTAWRFATWPTSRSPDLVNPTTDGVMRLPSGLVMTTGSPAFHHRHDGVGRAQVDSNNLAHDLFVLASRRRDVRQIFITLIV